VFPSYFEGLAQVQLEGLAAGLPLSHGSLGCFGLDYGWHEGYIIPVGDAEALRDALQRFIAAPNDLVLMSTAARLAAERHSWDAYGDRWMNLLRQVS